jgi:hypothetical protein
MYPTWRLGKALEVEEGMLGVQIGEIIPLAPQP